jgi:TatA/E family protein of Tat protein translocase
MLSLPHLVVLFVVALVIFGPEKLPELARTLGKLTAEFRRATGDLRSSFEDQMRQLERDAAEIDRKKRELASREADKQTVVAEASQPAGATTPQFTIAPEITESAAEAHESQTADLDTSSATSPGEAVASEFPRIASPVPAPVMHTPGIQPEVENVTGADVHRS